MLTIVMVVGAMAQIAFCFAVVGLCCVALIVLAWAVTNG